MCDVSRLWPQQHLITLCTLELLSAILFYNSRRSIGFYVDFTLQCLSVNVYCVLLCFLFFSFLIHDLISEIQLTITLSYRAAGVLFIVAMRMEKRDELMITTFLLFAHIDDEEKHEAPKRFPREFSREILTLALLLNAPSPAQNLLLHRAAHRLRAPLRDFAVSLCTLFFPKKKILCHRK